MKYPGRENVYGHRKRLDFFLSEIRARAGRGGRPARALRLLDVGCGTGVMVTRPLAEMGYEVTGLDTDDASIRQALRLNEGRDGLPNLRYVHGAIETLPPEEPFDVILCSEVLEHLKEPERLLSAIRERLSEDGLLLVTVPNGYGPFEIDSHLWERLSRVPGFWRLPDLWLRGKARLLAAGGRHEAARAAAEEDHPDRLASLTVGQPHCQVFTRRTAVALFERCGLRPVRFGASSVWAGPFANLLLRDFPSLVRLDCALADRLPSFLVSGFYFSLRKAEEPLQPEAARRAVA